MRLASIAVLAWLAAQLPAPDPLARLSSLPALVAEAFAEPGRGGTVLVARDGTVVFRRAYGSADLELGVPMRPDHVLGIGSITKQMTAVAILKLVHQGRLALDDDVREHWPTMQTHGRRITIAQALTHTSGLANFVDRPDFDALSRRDLSVAEILALTDDLPLAFEPGTGYHYSDSAYILLGAVIERISGRPYADYMEAEIFRPLGMRDTWYGDEARIIPRRARGYTRHEHGFGGAPYISMSIPRAAGGIFSTVDDLLRWDQALRAGQVVPLSLLRQAWQPQSLPDGTTTGHGFGWKLCTVGDQPTIEQGGFINGFGANLLVLPEAGLTIAVLVNNDADAPDAGGLARRIARHLLTGRADPPRHRLSSAERARLVGHYRIGGDDRIRAIVEHDGRLYSQVADGARHELFALSPTMLARSDGDGSYALQFEFDSGESGPATSYGYALRCSPPNERGTRLEPRGR